MFRFDDRKYAPAPSIILNLSDDVKLLLKQLVQELKREEHGNNLLQGSVKKHTNSMNTLL